MKNKVVDPDSRSWLTPGTLFALVLFCAALVYGFHRYTRLTQPPRSSQPAAIQRDRILQQGVESDYRRKLDGLNLTPDKRRQLDQWMKIRLGSGATKEQRKARNDQLAAILAPDQIERFRQIQKEYAEDKKSLNESRENRMKTMLGERDYALRKENAKKIQDTVRARKPTPVPTATPNASAGSATTPIPRNPK